MVVHRGVHDARQPRRQIGGQARFDLVARGAEGPADRVGLVVHHLVDLAEHDLEVAALQRLRAAREQEHVGRVGRLSHQARPLDGGELGDHARHLLRRERDLLRLGGLAGQHLGPRAAELRAHGLDELVLGFELARRHAELEQLHLAAAARAIEDGAIALRHQRRHLPHHPTADFDRRRERALDPLGRRGTEREPGVEEAVFVEERAADVDLAATASRLGAGQLAEACVELPHHRRALFETIRRS
jgi:hypothetical protein